MYLSFWIAFLIIDTFSSFADGSLDGPRVTLRDKDVPVQRYSLPMSNGWTELLLGSGNRTLYVGGHGKIWAINFEKVNRLEEVNFFERVKTEPKSAATGLNMKCMENLPGTGIAPFNMTEQAPSLSIEDKQDRVYTFLVQKETDPHPEASPLTSWVSQICTADIGGPKAILQGKWTSRLNARLACGERDQGQLFDQLLDVVVLKDENWRDSRCVSDSTKLPNDVLKHMMDYPDMENWVWPIDGSGPLMVSHSHYRRIQVDSVMGSRRSHKKFNVLLLSLKSGGLHKVVELDGKSFIIAEMQLFSSGTRIQNMLLQPSTKRLYVSSGREVVEVDLRACLRYGPRCEDCVLAQDPYCSWNGTHCSAVSASREHGDVFRKQG
ncbi:hypothetical protein JZ751_020454 [Albula glossodonta]|uniref:Sema domain-containing protein n=1 Tax=Albula glossodonta TaxID=121402 RepID=A0A8T2PL62_9TELE|nr:hypothetical protein JZ751_020454 [Albula glossodonta]